VSGEELVTLIRQVQTVREGLEMAVAEAHRLDVPVPLAVNDAVRVIEGWRRSLLVRPT
jgi:hypothetical protein